MIDVSDRYIFLGPLLTATWQSLNARPKTVTGRAVAILYHGLCRKLVLERRVTEGDVTLPGFIIDFSY